MHCARWTGASANLDENDHEQARHASQAVDSTTLDANPVYNYLEPQDRQGSPQLWTQIPVHKSIKPVRLGCPQLWT